MLEIGFSFSSSFLFEFLLFYPSDLRLETYFVKILHFSELSVRRDRKCSCSENCNLNYRQVAWLSWLSWLAWLL